MQNLCLKVAVALSSVTVKSDPHELNPLQSSHSPPGVEGRWGLRRGSVGLDLRAGGAEPCVTCGSARDGVEVASRGLDGVSEGGSRYSWALPRVSEPMLGLGIFGSREDQGLKGSSGYMFLRLSRLSRGTRENAAQRSAAQRSAAQRSAMERRQVVLLLVLSLYCGIGFRTGNYILSHSCNVMQRKAMERRGAQPNPHPHGPECIFIVSHSLSHLTTLSR